MSLQLPYQQAVSGQSNGVFFYLVLNMDILYSVCSHSSASTFWQFRSSKAGSENNRGGKMFYWYVRKPLLQRKWKHANKRYGHITNSPFESSKSHLVKKRWGKGKRECKGVKEERVRKERERARGERRCNYQECSLRDQLHFKEAGAHVPCSTQPQVPVLWE